MSAAAAGGAAFTPKSKFKNLVVTSDRDRKFVDAKPHRTPLLHCNEENLAVTWNTGVGTVALLPMHGEFGRITNPTLIECHPGPILDMKFSPLDASILITSGQQDNDIKLWHIAHTHDIPVAGSEVSFKPDGSLSGMTNPANVLQWHPSAAATLASAHGKQVCVWDVASKSVVQTYEDVGGTVQSFVWSIVGDVILFSTKEKSLGLLDARSGKIVQSGSGPEGKGGLCTLEWLGDGPYVASFGFSKSSERQFTIFDARKSLAAGLQTTTVDSGPGILLPLYDEDTKLLLVGAKGDRAFRSFEINDDAEIDVLPAATSTFESPLAAVCKCPKTVVDVIACEIVRAIKLSGDNSIETLRITVPRKNKEVFHEDLYVPTRSATAVYASAREWRASVSDKAQPRLSLAPGNMKSVYEISESEGGKVRQTGLVKFGGKTINPEGIVVSGLVCVDKNGEMGSLVDVNPEGWVKCEAMFNTKGLQIILMMTADTEIFFSMDRLLRLSKDKSPRKELHAVRFAIRASPRVYTILVPPESAQLWMLVGDAASLSKSEADSPQVVSPTEPAILGEMLSKLSPSAFKRWEERFVQIRGGALAYYVKESSAVAKNSISLSSILHVSAVKIWPKKNELDRVFEVVLPNRKYHFLCRDAAQVEKWVSTLQRLIGPQSPTQSAPSASLLPSSPTLSSSADWTGPTAGWVTIIGKKRWVQIAGTAFQVFATDRAPRPLDSFPLKNIKKTVAQQSKKGDCSLLVEFVDESKQVWQFEDNEACGEWTEAFSRYLFFNVDILLQLGVTQASMSEKIDKIPPALEIDFARKHNFCLRVVGRKKIRVVLASTSLSEFDERDVMIIATASVIYQWNGQKSGKMQRAKALDCVTTIKFKDRAGSATVIIIDSPSALPPEVVSIVGESKKGIPSSQPYGETDTVAEEIDKKIGIYQIGEAMRWPDSAKLIHSGSRASSSILLSTNCYICDTGREVLQWVGKRSTPTTRDISRRVVLALLKQPGRPSTGAFVSVNEGSEVVVWKERFSDYSGSLPIATGAHQMSPGNVAQTITSKMDIKPLLKRLPPPIPPKKFDNSRISVWRIEGFEKVEVGEILHGHFVTRESYLILHTYKYGVGDKSGGGGVDRYRVFFWIGRLCPTLDGGAAALISASLVEDSADVPQIRVQEGHETGDFLSLFDNVIVVHASQESLSIESSALKFYDVRPLLTEPNFGRCVEYPHPVPELNPESAAVIVGDSHVRFWVGPTPLPGLRDIVDRAVSKMRTVTKARPSNVVEVREAQLTPLLPTKPKVSYSVPHDAPQPRFFIGSAVSGAMRFFESQVFDETELDAGHTAMLETPIQVIVWVGARCSHGEVKAAIELATEFVSLSRPLQSIPVVVARQGLEPVAFTRYFQWSKPIVSSARCEPSAEVMANYTQTKYSYDQLLQDDLPDTVDSTRLETYLIPEEFKEIFGMSLDEFSQLPKWKADELKKAKYLY